MKLSSALSALVRNVRNAWVGASVTHKLRSLQESPFGHKLISGAWWSLVSSMTARLLGLCSSIIIARQLDAHSFGELGMIQSTVGMFATFAGFGLSLASTKYVEEYRIRDPLKAGRVLAACSGLGFASGLFAALVLICFASWIAQQTLGAPQLAGLLRVASGLLFFGALTGTQSGALIGFGAFRTIARINLVSGLLNLPLMAAGVHWFGLYGAVSGMVLASAVAWLLNSIALRQAAARANVPLRVGFNWIDSRSLFRFSLPAMISGVMVGPVNWVCAAMLAHAPNGFKEIGYFSVANQWRLAILFIPSAISQVVLPLLVSSASNRDVEQYDKVLQVSVVLNIVSSGVAALLLILLGQRIMSLYGPSYHDGTLVLTLLSISAVLMCANNVVGQALVSHGKMWIGVFFNAFWALLLVSGSKAFIDGGYGAAGLGYAAIIAYSMHTVLQTFYLRRVLSPNRVAPSRATEAEADSHADADRP